jgi:hypothetical protein
MTLLDFEELRLLNKSLKILNQQWNMVSDESQSEYPEAEFTLKEVSDINAVIHPLNVIRRMYAGK